MAGQLIKIVCGVATNTSDAVMEYGTVAAILPYALAVASDIIDRAKGYAVADSQGRLHTSQGGIVEPMIIIQDFGNLYIPVANRQTHIFRRDI